MNSNEDQSVTPVKKARNETRTENNTPPIRNNEFHSNEKVSHNESFHQSGSQ